MGARGPQSKAPGGDRSRLTGDTLEFGLPAGSRNDGFLCWRLTFRVFIGQGTDALAELLAYLAEPLQS